VFYLKIKLLQHSAQSPSKTVFLFLSPLGESIRQLAEDSGLRGQGGRPDFKKNKTFYCSCYLIWIEHKSTIFFDLFNRIKMDMLDHFNQSDVCRINSIYFHNLRRELPYSHFPNISCVSSVLNVDIVLS